MEDDHFSQNDSLAFPLSFEEETAGPEVQGPSRFARALKRARFARGWTQTRLAAQLAITKRSVVSWETGERIPSVGIVVLLLDVLFPDDVFSLHRELLCAYIVDDLERQGQRRDPQHHQNDLLLQRAQRMIELVLQLPKGTTQERSAQEYRAVKEQITSQWEEDEPLQPEKEANDQEVLEPLFTLMAQLRQHPELIPVARDFIRELAPGG